MVKREFGRAAMTAVACLMVSACGGGGGGSTPTTTTAPAAATPAATTAAVQTQAEKEADAGRLAKQATFGGTPALINHIVAIGVNAWLDEQFAATGSTYSDIVAGQVTANACGGDSSCYNNKFTRQPVGMRFYSDALSQPDQLRQRVAFALSQLMVASSLAPNSAAAIASLNQLFLDNAFGNYRNLLMSVTLQGWMGLYLNMANSAKAAPNENYAREMLQLFSMGPNRLNLDGTFVTDSTGAAQPNYTPDDIKGVARALTGWTWPKFQGDPNTIDLAAQMIQVPANYDSAAKSFLGVTVPAGASQTDSVAAVVDAAFNNPSTPPYIAKFLIRQFVTSNPTPAYVGRVAAVFVNNGSNVRGDLKAVIRAVLTDSEARTAPSGDGYGKVKEPILLMTSIARAIGMTSDGIPFFRDTQLGQPIFTAPSVFNFYPPDYPLPQSTTLLSPASKLMTTGAIVVRNNMAYDWTLGAVAGRGEFAPQTVSIGSTGSAIDWSPWEALGTDTAALVDRIDLIMMNRTMTAALKTALTNAINAVTDSNPATQARKRAATAVYIVGTSPLFQVDR